MAEEKRDILPAVALVAGGAALAAGVYFFMKKPAGLDQGDTFTAVFSFDYSGSGGTYVIQVSLGNILLGQWFDHVEGLTWTREVSLPAANHYNMELECQLPMAITPQTFDAEALIRTSSMSQFDSLIKVLTKDAVKVRAV